MIRTEGGHFWITFENGYTLSVFNGFGSYTENHNDLEKWTEILDKRNVFANSWESTLFEIAILGSNGEFKTQEVLKNDDDVKTVDLQELISIINLINEMKGE